MKREHPSRAALADMRPRGWIIFIYPVVIGSHLFRYRRPDFEFSAEIRQHLADGPRHAEVEVATLIIVLLRLGAELPPLLASRLYVARHRVAAQDAAAPELRQPVGDVLLQIAVAVIRADIDVVERP